LGEPFSHQHSESDDAAPVSLIDAMQTLSELPSVFRRAGVRGALSQPNSVARLTALLADDGAAVPAAVAPVQTHSTAPLSGNSGAEPRQGSGGASGAAARPTSFAR